MPDARELYLDAWDFLVADGYYYCNEGEWRLDGSRHCVDCSGGCYLCSQKAGRPLPSTCTNSFEMSRLCHNFPRPQWLNDLVGPCPWTGSFQMGTGVSMASALEHFPAAWGFHGPNQGMTYGEVGHIKNLYWINHPFRPHAGYNVSVEAMSHALDLRYAHFTDPEISYVGLPPNLIDCFAPPVPEVLDPMIVACNNKPTDAAGNKPYAQLILPNALFPRGIVICRHGASIGGDQPVKHSDVRTWVPPHLHGKLVAMCERVDRKGVFVIDDTGATTRGADGQWS